MPPTTFEIWKQNIDPLIQAVEIGRGQAFKDAFNGLPDVTFVTNTSKIEKAIAQLALIEHYIGVPILLNEGAILFEKQDQQEMMSPDAQSVAAWKAAQVLRYRREIQANNSEIIAAGADVNAFRLLKSKEVQSHKLARLPTEEITSRAENIRKNLIEDYTTPPEGVVRIRWDLGMHFINGSEHPFGDEIEILSKPIDKELLEKALDEAMENGLFLSSNLQFAAIECLIENGKIFSVAFLPRELKLQGKTLEEVRQRPTEELLNLALHSIVTNVPVRYQ